MTIYPDVNLKNANWSKRTPDTIKDLQLGEKKNNQFKADMKSIRSKYKRKKLK